MCAVLRCLGIAVCLWSPAAALARPSGALDAGFGAAGVVSRAVGRVDDAAAAIALQDDGRIVVAGSSSADLAHFLVLRLLLDGSPDASFGGAGAVVLPVGAGADRAQAVALQPDGRIVAAGFARSGSSEAFAVARLLPDGGADDEFGDRGRVVTSIRGLDDRIAAVAVQPDGRIVVAGYSRSSANRDVALARYESDGRLDASFGAGGVAIAPLGTGNDEAAAIALQPDGRILIAGHSANGGQFAVLVARFTADGGLDESFGAGGSARLRLSEGDSFGTALARAADGRIVVAGRARVGSVFRFAVARLTDGGALDPTFAGSGAVTTPIGASAEGRAVALSPDGRVAVAGVARLSGRDVLALARYRPDGVLDPHFSGGTIAGLLAGAVESGAAVAVQPDDAIVVAGSTRRANDDDVLVARFLADDCGDGLVDRDEECDPGATAACCTAECALVAAGTLCREAADACDVADACDGVRGDCPDRRLPDGDGDGTCDERDVCPATPDPDQRDRDGDGAGDACDPCTLGSAMDVATLRLPAAATPPEEAMLRFVGRFALSATGWSRAPARGVRVLLEAAGATTLVDEALPPAPFDAVTRRGWVARRDGAVLVYRDFGPDAVIKRLLLRRRDGGAVRAVLQTRRGAVEIPPAALPTHAVVALAAPVARDGECGETDLAGGCARDGGGRLVCRQ